MSHQFTFFLLVHHRILSKSDKNHQMSLDGLFCGIKAIGRFSEERCEALQTKGNMQQQNTKVVLWCTRMVGV